ncbi:hypothetical protein ERHA55_51800 (plasmid) [Erwinia rhapontici]|nr:hypothetical protein ERHA55_51800 [Erwinia rhapontici]
MRRWRSVRQWPGKCRQAKSNAHGEFLYCQCAKWLTINIRPDKGSGEPRNSSGYLHFLHNDQAYFCTQVISGVIASPCWLHTRSGASGLPLVVSVNRNGFHRQQTDAVPQTVAKETINGNRSPAGRSAHTPARRAIRGRLHPQQSGFDQLFQPIGENIACHPQVYAETRCSGARRQTHRAGSSAASDRQSDQHCVRPGRTTG